MAKKDESVFVVLSDDDEIYILTKDEIESLIKEAETSPDDIEFETIAKVKKVHLNPNITKDQIEWFKGADNVSDKLAARVILTIVHRLIK